jgi:hypothetical protein
MARKSPGMGDVKRHEPIAYRRLEKFADRRRGKADGRRGLPELSAPPTATPRAHLVTPYLETLKRHFTVGAEHEFRRKIEDLEEPTQRQEAIRQRITETEERLAKIRKNIDDMPERPSEDALADRSHVELHAHEALVRRRRQREHEARRDALLKDEQQAEDALGVLRVEARALARSIADRELIYEATVRQLREHTMRRATTYLGGLVHRHDGGEDLNRLLRPVLHALLDGPPGHDRAAGPPGAP